MQDILKNVEGLSFCWFDEGDVVRHHLVQRIIRAYDEHKNRVAEEQLSLLESRSAAAPKSNGADAAAVDRRGVETETDIKE